MNQQRLLMREEGREPPKGDTAIVVVDLNGKMGSVIGRHGLDIWRVITVRGSII